MNLPHLGSVPKTLNCLGRHFKSSHSRHAPSTEAKDRLHNRAAFQDAFFCSISKTTSLVSLAGNLLRQIQWEKIHAIWQAK